MNFKNVTKTWILIGGAVAGLIVLSQASVSFASLRADSADLNRTLDNCEKKALFHLQENLAHVAQISGTNEIGNLSVVSMQEQTTSRNLIVYKVKVLRTNLSGDPVGCLAKLSESGLELNRPNAIEVCAVSYRDRGGKYQGQVGVTLPRT